MKALLDTHTFITYSFQSYILPFPSKKRKALPPSILPITSSMNVRPDCIGINCEIASVCFVPRNSQRRLRPVPVGIDKLRLDSRDNLVL